MAHAAIAFAKAHFRRRMMACTTSIGPGATNLVTAAATAHVNRLPVLLLPGDVFVSRAPDPVLQQVEDFHDGGVSANDCFRPVSRYFDRIVAPSQLLTALPRAIARADRSRAVRAGHARAAAGRAGGGVRLSRRSSSRRRSFASARRCPRRSSSTRRRRCCARRSGRCSSPAAACSTATAAPTRCAGSPRRTACRSPRRRRARARCPGTIRCRPGAIGVTGAHRRQRARARRRPRPRRRHAAAGLHDRLALAVSRRRGSWPSTSMPSMRCKWRATAVHGDAATTLDALSARAGAAGRPAPRGRRRRRAKPTRGARRCRAIVGVREVAPPALPYDGEVIGAVQRSHPQSAAHDIVVCAAGTLPAELHKLWRAARPGGYHIEYGYSCMGYEIAGGIGVKMAHPEREVVVMVGDGSYLMLNSEIATSVMLGTKLVIVVLDNRGYGCIHRLQQAVRRRGLQQPVRRLRAGRARDARRSTSRRTRARSARWPSTWTRSPSSRRRSRGRAPPIAPTSSSSTPIRCAPPRRAAGGGRSACRKSPTRTRCARRAREYEHGKRLQRP